MVSGNNSMAAFKYTLIDGTRGTVVDPEAETIAQAMAGLILKFGNRVQLVEDMNGSKSNDSNIEHNQ